MWFAPSTRRSPTAISTPCSSASTPTACSMPRAPPRSPAVRARTAAPRASAAYFADASAGWDVLDLHPDDFRSIPGFVVAFGHATARRGDESIRRAIVWTWQLRDGKAIMLRVADVGEATD